MVDKDIVFLKPYVTRILDVIIQYYIKRWVCCRRLSRIQNLMCIKKSRGKIFLSFIFLIRVMYFRVPYGTLPFSIWVFKTLSCPRDITFGYLSVQISENLLKLKNVHDTQIHTDLVHVMHHLLEWFWHDKCKRRVKFLWWSLQWKGW